jgi:NADPH:quinone reductase-like Zn-dependent oxidoreductase
MKAVVMNAYGGPEVMELTEVPPPPLYPRDVRVKVYAASINPIDFKIRSGQFKRVLKYTLPLPMGFDVAGEVVETGMRATHFDVGDRVYACVQSGRVGTLAEEITVERTDVAPMPKSLSYEQAAAVPLVALTAWQVLVDHMRLKQGQSILVHAGAGGVGTFAIQFAKHLGARVTATASAPKHAMLKELGADECIDHKSQDFTQGGPRFDAVFDTIGGENLMNSFKVVKPGGTVVSIVSLPDEPTAKRLGLNPLVRFALRFMNRRITAAAKQAQANYRFHSATPAEAQLRRIAEIIDAGHVRPVIDSVFPLEQFREAFAKLESGHATGKIVVRVREEPAKE